MKFKQVLNSKYVFVINLTITFSGVIRQQEREMEELKGKMVQVLAVMPSETFSPPITCSTSKLRLAESPSPSAQSNLDPNATAYTPKANSHLAPAAEA